MAVKKKIAKRASPKKPAKRPAPKRPSAATPQAQPKAEPAATKGGGVSLAPFVIFALVIAGLYFTFRKDEVPLVHKESAGLQAVASPVPANSPAPALQAPATAQAAPQKRATSPDGPRVWDRSKTKGPVRFFIVRDKGGMAEVVILKAGNVPVCSLHSDKGPRATVELKWDGKDAKGAQVTAGTYYARISGAHGENVEEILVK